MRTGVGTRYGTELRIDLKADCDFTAIAAYEINGAWAKRSRGERVKRSDLELIAADLVRARERLSVQESRFANLCDAVIRTNHEDPA